MARVHVAPGYERLSDGYRGVLVVKPGVVLQANGQYSGQEQLTLLWGCDCWHGDYARRGHGSIPQALQCAWQARGQAQLAEVDPVQWKTAQEPI